MKKLFLIIAALFIAAFFAGSAFCGPGVYVGAGVGMTFMSESEVTDSTSPGEKLDFEFDSGFGGYLALGYAFDTGFRVEGEVSYQVNDFDETVRGGTTYQLSGDISCLAFLVNGYYDFKNKSSFTPFVTAGAGVAKVETAEFSIPGTGFDAASDDDTVFAWQVGAGISYDFSDKTSVVLKYRFFGTDEVSLDTMDAEYYSHNIYIGTRLTF